MANINDYKRACKDLCRKCKEQDDCPGEENCEKIYKAWLDYETAGDREYDEQRGK